jgi:hypothetical protein
LLYKFSLNYVGYLLEYIVYVGAMGGMQPLLIFMNKKLNERANDRADFISKFELKLMRVTI